MNKFLLKDFIQNVNQGNKQKYKFYKEKTQNMFLSKKKKIKMTRNQN